MSILLLFLQLECITFLKDSELKSQVDYLVQINFLIPVV